MKIILTVVSPNIEAALDPRFGRGAYLLIVDTDSLRWEAHQNPGVTTSGGAGIQAAQFITDLKVDAVLSGDFGPNAFEALQAAKIPMYLYNDCHTVRQAIERFKAGELQQVGVSTQADNDGGHHG
jgi:predicted Fe-Mo cluster-binding NifX family protein